MTRAESVPGRLASKVKDAGREMNQAMNGMGVGIGGNLQAAFGSIGNQASGVVSRLSAMVSGLGAVAGAAIVAAAAIAGIGVGLTMLANRGAESITVLRRLASQAGLTTQSMAALSTMEGAGGADGFARAMTTMQKNIANMSGEAVTALARIRLDPSQLRGQNSEAQLRMIANAFANTADHATRTSAAMAIFGDSGAGMVEELSRGAAGLDALSARAQRFGLTFTESQGNAIRNANRQWENFGLAIEGISRQAAILFAPMWESIGRIGGDVGEWLVGAFRNAVPYIQAAGRWIAIVYETVMSIGSAVVRVGGIFVDWFGGIISGVIRQFFGGWQVDWDSIQLRALQVMAVVKVGAENIGTSWHLAIAAVQLAWATLARSIIGIISSIATTLRDGLVQPIISSMRQLINSMSAIASLDPTGRLTEGLNTARAAINALGRVADGVVVRFDTTALDRQINELREALRARLGDFGAQVGSLVARWMRDLAGGVREAGRNAALALPVTTGRDRAVTGHEATLSTSDRAFSLLYSTRGQEDYYQRQTAEATRASRTSIDRLVRAFETAPSLRRARI